MADPEKRGGTTTFLVRDAAGDLAAGVSTCGWALKYPGRVGDSCVVGAGLYADNGVGAAACTGHGELTIRAGTARAVVLHMQHGMSVADACRTAADDLRRLARDFPGAITIHAMDAAGATFVLALGRSPPMSVCWYWDDTRGAPEQCPAVPAEW
jgi:L-asparaginase